MLNTPHFSSSSRLGLLFSPALKKSSPPLAGGDLEGVSRVKGEGEAVAFGF
ncbi:MAG: hypothetical protein KKC21_06825 [Nitrospinae bacterium]|nr:hypothetical protein [Nitrospinota bacterium]